MSDTHAAHKYGLCNPAVVLVRELDDGKVEEWTPELTQTQRYLWTLFINKLAEAKEIVGHDEVVAIHCGDVTHGDRWADGLMPGLTREDQRRIAEANLSPILELPTVRKLRLITGTLAHVPESAEARIAHRLALASGKDVASYHHGRLRVGENVVLEVAHHGPPPGSRDWLRGNVAFYHLRDRVYQDRRRGVQPADVYIYGHYHEWVWVSLHDTWRGDDTQHHLTVVPSFCGPTAYARNITRSAPTLTNGLVLFEIAGGRLASIRCLKETLDLRAEETL